MTPTKQYDTQFSISKSGNLELFILEIIPIYCKTIKILDEDYDDPQQQLCVICYDLGFEFSI